MFPLSYMQISKPCHDTVLKSDSPGNSKKLDVRRCRPLAVFWKFSGPMSSFDKFDMLEATESLEPLLEAKYARPPLTDPFRLGELGLEKNRMYKKTVCNNTP